MAAPTAPSPAVRRPIVFRSCFHISSDSLVFVEYQYVFMATKKNIFASKENEISLPPVHWHCNGKNNFYWFSLQMIALYRPLTSPHVGIFIGFFLFLHQDALVSPSSLAIHIGDRMKINSSLCPRTV